MSDYAPAMPHGQLDELFPGVHFVTGTMRMEAQGQTWQFSRNMTVLEHDGVLTLINAVRLDDAGLAALDDLGRVEHVIQLGSLHGLDDAFYVDRYSATLWAHPGVTHQSGKDTDRVLTPGGDFPVPGCALFAFETSSKPEGLVLVGRAGGILIACDSLQNWVEPDEYFSPESAAMMKQIGFFAPANVGPGWIAQCSPEASDFARIKELEFQHLLSAHGTPLANTAHQDLATTFQRMFGV